MKKNTADFDNVRINKELIRRYEDPEYAKAAEEYERQARAAKKNGGHQQPGQHRQPEGASTSASKKNSFSYDDYLGARSGGKGKHSAGARPRSSAQSQPTTRPRSSAQSQPTTRPRSSAQPQPTTRPRHSAQPQPKVRKAESMYKMTGRSGRRNKKRKSKAGCLKAGLIFLVVVLLVILGFLGHYIWDLTSSLDRIDTDGKDFGIDPAVEDSLSNYRNVVILGSDARKDEGYDGSRTDAILILSIDKKSGESRMISVMRDSYLQIQDPEGDLVLDKITHAHAFGGGMDTTRALNRNLDLNIKEFVIFNWQAVADTVDALDGIEIDVKKKELNDLNHYGKETGKNVGKKFHKVKKAGVQTLDGVQATTYCRIRKTSGGDTGRGNRYKKVVEGVMKKLAANPGKAKTLSDEVMPQIRTNMSRMQVTTLMARMARTDMKKSISWPKKYYGGIVHELWYAVPQTLNSNVKTLHKKAFGQKDYKPSKTCRKISKLIEEDTGVY